MRSVQRRATAEQVRSLTTAAGRGDGEAVGGGADLGSEAGIGFQGLCDVGEEAGQGKARIALRRHESRWYPRMLPPNDSGRNRGATASGGVDQ